MSPVQPSLARGLMWSVMAAFFAAGFLIPYRFAVEGAPRLAAMTAMFIAAAVFNIGVAAVRTRGRGVGFDRLSLLTAGILAACTVVGNLGVAHALPDIGAGMTSVVLKAQVVLTPMMAAVLLSEPASKRLWVGAVLAFSGVGLPQVAADQTGGGIGYAWAFGGAVIFAAMQIVTRRVATRIPLVGVNALRLVIAVLLIQLTAEGREVWHLSTETWLYATAAGVLGPGLSRLCLMGSARHVSPSLSALVALSGTVFAFVLGYIFFREAPSTLQLLGAALVVFGVLWPLLPAVWGFLSSTPNRARPQVPAE